MSPKQGANAYLECSVVERLEAGDHWYVLRSRARWTRTVKSKRARSDLAWLDSLGFDRTEIDLFFFSICVHVPMAPGSSTLRFRMEVC